MKGDNPVGHYGSFRITTRDLLKDMVKKAIVLIDDSLMVCKLIRMTLETLGHSVFSFTEVKLGLERIYGGGVDLVLLDINMPDVTGLALCKALKKGVKTRDLPIVFLSSIEEAKLAKYTEECGADGFIHKNKGRKELAHAVNHVVRTILQDKEKEP